ncbi:MAG TPA: alginate export family protein [Anaerohalosphaeraceae bacterium]|nr:alginate export family protein [Anaerohalosphaeraceae bacterium]HOL88941.1 alginate export family protein [Anaerohalosphaeraceae bacterium]HPP56133.1 alginate export family protein [Anaerohalosphaeraceae bacterium]
MKAMKGLGAVLAAALLNGIVSFALAEEAAKHWHEVDSDLLKAFKNPMEDVTMGLDLRLREVYGRNLLSMNEDWGGSDNYNDHHWQRIRTRWSLKWAMAEDMDLNTRLTWEFWNHCKPENHPIPFFENQNVDFDEAIFDIFNIQWRNAFDMPLTLTVGRQEIILGTGWLVLDGTPADGSRTIFFDAIRAQYGLTDTLKADVIYIQQYDDEEEYIKPFNHHAVQDRRHLTQKTDERGFIFYLTNKADGGQQQELYYIYKNEENSDWAQSYSSTPGQDADIHTIGGRLSGPLDDHWSYSAELAKQWGDRNGNTLQGLGANTKLMYAFNDEKKNEVHVGYEYLSGDDPDSSADEKFDSLWGDWPQYQRGGDLQSYIWTYEGALGEVNNLHRLGFGHSFKPNKVWTINTDYNLLWADQTNPRVIGGGANTLTDSNFRGHLLSGLATYSCCKNFKTHFMLDYLIPGDYYQISDDAYFARVHLEWTF